MILRSLRFYWRTNLAVVLGVATAVAVLAGALLVGDSVRGSLRDLVLSRLGRADRAVVAGDFFREALAGDVQGDAEFRADLDGICPLIVMPGTVSDQESGRRAPRVQVYGVDDRFWRFHRIAGVGGPGAREAFVSRALAADLAAAEGQSLLVRVERPSAIPIESLHGRKDNVGRTLRLTLRRIAPPEEMGDFSLQPQQGAVRAVFVALTRLQTDLGVSGRVNAMLLAGARSPERVEGLLRRLVQVDDVGLTVRASGDVVVEGAAGVLDPRRTRAIEQAATAVGLVPQPVFTYLANTIRVGDREVPYSLVAALPENEVGILFRDAVRPSNTGRTDGESRSPASTLASEKRIPTSIPGGGDSGPEKRIPTSFPIALNDWTARELGARAGDPLTLDYYVWEEPGRLTTRSADFKVAGIVPIAGIAAARDLAPVYPGITEAKTLGDWDPPFPIDLRRIRPADEAYWNTYRTTPKAFIPFAVGQQLWGSRFGDRTSVRLSPAAGESATAARDRFAAALRARIDPAAFGLTARAVREEGLRASRGATDFGEYFTYFSFFLVASALLLAALFFRLTVEQRAREIGLLRAVGFTPARVRRVFLAEALVLGTIGCVLGVAGAIAYGWAMMYGLRTWWSGAVGTTALRLHVAWPSLAAGAGGALAAAMICTGWTLRRLSGTSERSLLAGELDRRGEPAWPPRGRRIGRPLPIAVGVGVAAVALVVAGATTRIDRTAAFFGSGTLLLVACLFGIAFTLRRREPSRLDRAGRFTLGRLGVRNAADRPGRSVLAIGVIASATFLLVAVDAFRRTPASAADRHGGTGGYALLVDLLLPLATDPNSRDGLEALGLTASDGARIDTFRVRPGDDASCLNLYEPTNPRMLGVSRTFIESGRFGFQSSLAATDAERANPWRLLERDLGDGVVPAIADANSMTYVLHKNLGDDIVVAAGDRPVRLRLVAALDDSLFQRELLMSDANFVKLFPEQEGYRFLLIDGAVTLEQKIEQSASDLGADAEQTTARLAEFHTVENTYLATFQALGGLGLLVGTIGLTAVILRNVLERRRELALLGAVGYRPQQIFGIVIAENLWLVAWGLAIGTVSALVAIAPTALERGGRLPATATGAGLIVAVFLAGLLSSAVATRAALRTPLLEALRSE